MSFSAFHVRLFHCVFPHFQQMSNKSSEHLTCQDDRAPPEPRLDLERTSNDACFWCSCPGDRGGNVLRVGGCFIPRKMNSLTSWKKTSLSCLNKRYIFKCLGFFPLSCQFFWGVGCSYQSFEAFFRVMSFVKHPKNGGHQHGKPCLSVCCCCCCCCCCC